MNLNSFCQIQVGARFAKIGSALFSFLFLQDRKFE